LVESRGLAHLAALGLVSMMLRCVTVKTVKLVDPIEIRQTALERQDLSCTYLAHDELESVNVTIVITLTGALLFAALTCMSS